MPRGRTSAPAEFTVKIARTGGRVTEVVVEKGSTVEQALDASEIDWSETDRIRKNGASVQLDSKVAKDDVITIAGKIKGGKTK